MGEDFRPNPSSGFGFLKPGGGEGLGTEAG